jgi:hypothetical protein
VAAFKPVGELTPQDQGALRAVFARAYGRSDPAAEGMRQELEKLDAAEPERRSRRCSAEASTRPGASGRTNGTA